MFVREPLSSASSRVAAKRASDLLFNLRYPFPLPAKIPGPDSDDEKEKALNEPAPRLKKRSRDEVDDIVAVTSILITPANTLVLTAPANTSVITPKICSNKMRQVEQGTGHPLQELPTPRPTTPDWQPPKEEKDPNAPPSTPPRRAPEPSPDELLAQISFNPGPWDRV